MKYITITLNPAIDRVMYCKTSEIDKTNRAYKTVLSAGGKGINSSRMLTALGEDVTAHILTGGFCGKQLCSMLSGEKIKFISHKISSETRNCIKIISDAGECTEFNESGGPVSESEVKTLIDAVANSTDNTHTVILGGSIPQGVDKAVYNSVIKLLKNRHVSVLADCDGVALTAAVEALPDMIKPNVSELSDYLGYCVMSDFTALEAARRVYVEKGVSVLCTLGKNGAVYAGKYGESTIASPYIPQSEIKGFSGAGDTFLAAFISAIDNGCTLDDAMRFAAYAASEKIKLSGTAVPRGLCAKPNPENIV